MQSTARCRILWQRIWLVNLFVARVSLHLDQEQVTCMHPVTTYVLVGMSYAPVELSLGMSFPGFDLLGFQVTVGIGFMEWMVTRRSKV